MGLVVISPAFDKGGNRKIDIELFGKFLVGELPRIGPKAYLIYKDLLSPDDEHPATDSGHQHNVVVSPFMQQRGWWGGLGRLLGSYLSSPKTYSQNILPR